MPPAIKYEALAVYLFLGRLSSPRYTRTVPYGGRNRLCNRFSLQCKESFSLSYTTGQMLLQQR